MNRRRVLFAYLASLLLPFLLIAPLLFAQLINDGSFENDPSAWEEYFATPCNPSGIGDWSQVNHAPENFEGQQTLWVGGVCNTTPPILRRNGARQTITLEDNAAVLSFWFHPVKLQPDPLNFDRAIVTINGDEIWSQDINGITDPAGWNNALVDISGYASDTVSLALEIRQNVDLSVANMFFDYIEVLHPDVEISQLVTLSSEDSLELAVTIENSGDVQLDALTVVNDNFAGCDQAVGSLPSLEPGESTTYTCTASTFATKQENTATVRATATELEYPVEANNTIEVTPVIPPSIPTFKQYIPVITHNYIWHSPLGEPNDVCDQAFPINLNQSGEFLAENTDDWYQFTLDSTSDINVSMANFVPVAGQITVWRGTCQALTFLGQNGDFATSKNIILTEQAAGNYYVWIINDGPMNTSDKYSLIVTTP